MYKVQEMSTETKRTDRLNDAKEYFIHHLKKDEEMIFEIRNDAFTVYRLLCNYLKKRDLNWRPSLRGKTLIKRITWSDNGPISDL